MTAPLNPQHIILLRSQMREAMHAYRHYDSQWNQLNDAFTAKIAEENRIRKATGRPPHSALSIAQQKGDNLALGDAMGAAQWFRDKAATIAAVITAEEAASRLLRDE